MFLRKELLKTTQKIWAMESRNQCAVAKVAARHVESREIYGEHGKRRYTQFFALYITYDDA